MGAAGSPALPGTHRTPDPKFHAGRAKMDAIRKGHAKDSQRYKADSEAQSTDAQNFSSESKRETEYVRPGPSSPRRAVGASRAGHGSSGGRGAPPHASWLCPVPGESGGGGAEEERGLVSPWER